MKKIWDTQGNQPFYGVNEQALHQRILSKQKQGYRITHISELLCMYAYAISGSVTLGMLLWQGKSNLFMYLLAGWMLLSAIYVYTLRLRRQQGYQRFDRSMQGDLADAIAVAGYQVRFSRLMRWNILPISLLIVLGIWNSGQPAWIIAGMLVFLVATGYASGWEHRVYERRKMDLEMLREKLLREE